MTNEAKVIMWALLDDTGEPIMKAGLYESKMSLLISHDLIPLRGLEAAEAHLVSKGRIPTEVEITIGNTTDNGYFVPTVKGVPDMHMIDYGCYGIDKSEVKREAALYLFDDFTGRGVDRFDITKDEQNILNAFFFDIVKVKGSTRKEAHDKLTSKVDAFLQRNEIAIAVIEAAPL